MLHRNQVVPNFAPLVAFRLHLQQVRRNIAARLSAGRSDKNGKREKGGAREPRQLTR
jgi:hypothetical protein